uniref:Uncharacterized protein n=1 Tax=Stomoxys calcitrans TaxID=35570 RepID=A0A1I8PET4_STOCA
MVCLSLLVRLVPQEASVAKPLVVLVVNLLVVKLLVVQLLVVPLLVVSAVNPLVVLPTMPPLTLPPQLNLKRNSSPILLPKATSKILMLLNKLPTI